MLEGATLATLNTLPLTLLVDWDYRHYTSLQHFPLLLPVNPCFLAAFHCPFIAIASTLLLALTLPALPFPDLTLPNSLCLRSASHCASLPRLDFFDEKPCYLRFVADIAYSHGLCKESKDRALRFAACCASIIVKTWIFGEERVCLKTRLCSNTKASG
jgi:hypothetical protein